MATSNRLLPALLLAAAACSMSTDSLKPKTNADCAAGTKACGYRCVPANDPATGCGGPSCSACPTAPANSSVACAPNGTCGFSCHPGWGDCDGQPGSGCELSVGGTDAGNCGACRHFCAPAGTACLQGLCEQRQWVTYKDPRGIANDGSKVCWVDADSSVVAGGRIMCWDPSIPATAPTPLANGLDPRAGAPGASHIAFDTTAVPAQPYATGGLLGVPANEVAVFQVSGTTPTPVFHDVEKVTGEGFAGLAAGNGGAYFVRGATGGPYPCFAQAAVSPRCYTNLVYRVRGLAMGGLSGKTLLFGFPDLGGAIAQVTAGSTSSSVVKEGLGSWPSRIAQFTTSSGTLFMFWADENSGNVWAAMPDVPILLDVGLGPTTMDIAADAACVVWTDRAAGKVREWRASDGAVFDLAAGGQPVGVTLLKGQVYWTDAAAQAVKFVSE